MLYVTSSHANVYIWANSEKWITQHNFVINILHIYPPYKTYNEVIKYNCNISKPSVGLHIVSKIASHDSKENKQNNNRDILCNVS